jgi:cystathionine beta-lyase/cystathionine gamma-synthase
VASLLKKWGVTSSAVSPEDGPEQWEALLQPGKTRLFYAEAISNPLCEVGACRQRANPAQWPGRHVLTGSQHLIRPCAVSHCIGARR